MRACDVILSDDGLQHYALQRDCEIIVVDGDRRFGNGRLLPSGPLRETPARLQGANAIVLNGGDAPSDGAMRMRLLASNAIALKYGTAKPLREFYRPDGACDCRHRQSAAILRAAARGRHRPWSSIRCLIISS